MRIRRASTAAARFRRIGLALGLLTLALPGCDQIEAAHSSASAALVGTDAEDAPPSAAADQQPRADMQSIGPEAAKRVYYQFIDDRGTVQFVERLSDVPAAWRDQVGYVEMDRPPPLTPEEARRSWQISDARATEILLATNSASTRAPNSASLAAGDGVILYSATWCGYCTKARAHLDRENIRYEIRDVDNPAAAQELREKTGRGGIPVLDFAGEILRGYEATHYDRAIRAIRG